MNICIAQRVTTGALLAATMAASSTGAWAETIDLLDPTKTLQQGNWTRMSEGPQVIGEVVHGDSIELSTIGASYTYQYDGQTYSGPAGSYIQWFYKESPLDRSQGYTLEFSLKVNRLESPHNPYDAGVMVYGGTVSPQVAFTGSPREQMIFLDEDGIGWGDESATYAMDTTDAFHIYTLAVTPEGVAALFVDGTWVMGRQDFQMGTGFGFGDMTNDAGVNGAFSIASMRLNNASPVPVPPSIWTFSLGLLAMGLRMRGRRHNS